MTDPSHWFTIRMGLNFKASHNACQLASELGRNGRRTKPLRGILANSWLTLVNVKGKTQARPIHQLPKSMKGIDRQR